VRQLSHVGLASAHFHVQVFCGLDFAPLDSQRLDHVPNDSQGGDGRRQGGTTNDDEKTIFKYRSRIYRGSGGGSRSGLSSIAGDEISKLAATDATAQPPGP
jgi:hypothetical protein